MRRSHILFLKAFEMNDWEFCEALVVNDDEEEGGHDMRLSHFFPFKAFLRANIVLKKAFSKGFSFNKAFLEPCFPCKGTDEKESYLRLPTYRDLSICLHT